MSDTIKKYTIEEHQHRFAAWAASRAASQRGKGVSFSGKNGQAILGKFREKLCGDSALKLEHLPAPEDIDKEHKKWREYVIDVAIEESVFSDEIHENKHGFAAKLINCYLKARFVCGDCDDERVKNLHPPIDHQLLKTLGSKKTCKHFGIVTFRLT